MNKERKMNTVVEYRRPSIRTAYGQYVSNSIWKLPGWWHFRVKISLVWFNSLGWYFIVEIDGLREKDSVIVHGPESRKTWPKGQERDACSFAAEEEAKKMCADLGVTVDKFEPFVLAPRYR